MAIRNRKGETLSGTGEVQKKRGRPKGSKNKQKHPAIEPPRPQSGPFHVMFPFHLSYKEDGQIKNCYFQAQSHMDKYLERYKLDKRKITIKQTEAKND